MKGANRPRSFAFAALFAGVGALTAPQLGEASICVAVNARQPALQVNGRGFAQVSWTTPRGRRMHALITPRGRCALRGVRMSGRDVSFPAVSVRIPFKRVVKRTPDGSLWALQVWRVRKHGPRDLRFSRWRGTPTRLTARAVCCASGRLTLRGRASFHGRPIYRRSVYVDCFACQVEPRGWARIARAVTRRDGSYALRLRTAWRGARYRVMVVGPNFGWTRAPDARAEIPSPFA